MNMSQGMFNTTSIPLEFDEGNKQGENVDTFKEQTNEILNSIKESYTVINLPTFNLLFDPFINCLTRPITWYMKITDLRFKKDTRFRARDHHCCGNKCAWDLTPCQKR